MINFSLRLMIFALAIILLMPTSINAKIYKRVDENGKVHYSDKPFDDDSKPLEIKDNVTPEQQREAQIRARKLIQRQQRSVNNQLESEYEAKQKKQEEERKEKKLNVACKRAKSSLRTLNMQRPVFQRDENGEPVFLSDEKRKKEMLKLREAIAQHCNK